MLSCSNIVVVRIEISRTYGDIVDYVIRKLEIRPIYGHQGTKFSRVFFNLTKAEISDMFSTDDEMPRTSAAN